MTDHLGVLGPAARDLPPRGWPRFLKLLGRAIRRRCPQCGAVGIFRNYWAMRERCPRCDYRFDREEGYFLGAYAVNLIVAEVLGLGTVLVVLFRGDYSLLVTEVVAIGAAVLLPVLFYPFSRTIWMTIDLMVDRDIAERQLRHGDMTDADPNNAPKT